LEISIQFIFAFLCASTLRILVSFWFDVSTLWQPISPSPSTDRLAQRYALFTLNDHSTFTLFSHIFNCSVLLSSGLATFQAMLNRAPTTVPLRPTCDHWPWRFCWRFLCKTQHQVADRGAHSAEVSSMSFASASSASSSSSAVAAACDSSAVGFVAVAAAGVFGCDVLPVARLFPG
jgi:hypothetical protein